ncbi:MAG: peptidase T [Clostridia bacterium]|nr:peptidase T [Clostridia bacterium]
MKDVAERFLEYVAFETTSDEDSGTSPSSAKELLLSAHLAEELRAIGLNDAAVDEYGYVYASLPATHGYENEPAIGLIAHVDTVPGVSGTGIRPRRFVYRGGDIPLSETIVTRVADFPFLETLTGEELIVTDGTTLLGADDKAGVAEIVQALETLVNDPSIPHGRVAVCFTPDEEIGEGTAHFDLDRFGADFAYTADGGLLGELEYECFNAAGAKLTVNGRNIHTGSAKNKMKNAVLMATEFIGMLPAAEAPAHTEGYEGFFHVGDISGNETKTVVKMLVRDFGKEAFERRKRFLESTADYLNAKYGAGTFVLDMQDTYYNMKEKILPAFHVVERAERAYRAEGIEPVAVPVRGGTDGARLSHMGLPCPNLCTGGANYHGVNELVSVDAMNKCVSILVRILRADG